MIKRFWQWLIGIITGKGRWKKISWKYESQKPIKKIKVIHSLEYQAKLDRRRKRKKLEIQSRRYNYKRLGRRG